MANKEFATGPSEKIVKYLKQTFRPEDPVLTDVVSRTRKAGLPEIQVGDMDGLHLEVLARAVGARKIVEIGTLAGYSGIHLARALPADGMLYTFEMSASHAEVARASFAAAGLADRVRIFVGPALQNLEKIVSEGPFDLVFIDADKVSYPKYLEWAARNLRTGGAVLGDNTLAWGMIADEKPEGEDAATVHALREFNDRIANGGRFRATMLPTGEGLTLGIKTK
jgi:caffeoyl-CoA O-methyltransferase